MKRTHGSHLKFAVCSIVAHAAVIALIARLATPLQYIPSTARSTPLAASERLVYVTPRIDARNDAKRPSTAQQQAAEREAERDAERVARRRRRESTPASAEPPIAAVADSMATTGTSPSDRSEVGGSASAERDSARTAATGYSLPVHPALRGLVPDTRTSALLGAPTKSYTRPTMIPPRPPPCTAAFFQCARELIQWRADSAIFAALECRAGSQRAARPTMLQRLRGEVPAAIADSGCRR